ncbi:MAG TPA: thioredoxin domain-containing protein [bacterium]|nr:thioredoxin domain-containing protein [bacterium]
MKTNKLILPALAILLAVPAFTACEPSPSQMEKSIQTFFDKNPQFLEKQFQDMMRKRNPEAEPLEDRIKKAITVDLNNAPTMGPDDAPVTMVIFSDFQCPFCKRAAETPKQLVEQYKGKVRIAFRQHPLPMHKNALPAAKAALAAHEQGKFWQYHDLLFANQQDLSEPNLIKLAQQAGLNVPKFTKAMKSTQFDKQIQDDTNFAMKNGASGTPAFFINGVSLKGAKPIAAFQEVIDKILEMKGLKTPAAAPAPGTQPPEPAPAPKG